MSTATLNAKAAITRKDAAEKYAISVWMVDELIAAGLVSAKRVGRRVLVNAQSMQDWYDGLEDA
ncbi:MAG: hypothetical protein HOV78_11485 [Hamadaea sp.]|nr:hypothetical protein [Hamadaea sp.]